VTQKTLAARDAKLSEVEGEVIMLSITSASQEISLREQGETVKRLELTVEAVRRDLEMEKKQVEGEPQSDSCLVGFSIGNSHSFFLIYFLPWCSQVLTVYFGAPSMFITLWFGFDYGTNPPLGTLII
jgi:hypothetical protein